MNLTLRNTKGSALTYAEADANFSVLKAQFSKFTFLSDWDTSTQYNTARDALAGKVALPPAVEIAPWALGAGSTSIKIRTLDTAHADFNFVLDDQSVSSGTRNNILHWGYNPTIGASREDTAEPAWFYSMEGDYNDGSNRFMESHMQGIHSDGTSFRNWSWTVNRSSKAIANSTAADTVTFQDRTRVYTALTIGSVTTTGSSVQFASGTSVSISGGTADQGSLLITGATTNTSNQTFGVNVSNTFPATSTVVGAGISVSLSTAASAFTCANLLNFYSQDAVKGAGSAITIQAGYWTADLTQGTTIYGFKGGVNAGTNRFNLYMDGTAQNFLQGATGIGIAPSATANLALLAGTTAISSLRIPHGAAPTSPVNGDVWTTSSGMFVRINGVSVGPLT